jgi:hypothetical protein
VAASRAGAQTGMNFSQRNNGISQAFEKEGKFPWNSVQQNGFEGRLKKGNSARS